MTATISKVTRRDFLTAVGIAAGGLTLMAGRTRLLSAATKPADAFSPNVFVTLKNDGTVVITVSRSEMGQGVRTALPMIIADEMEADWARVTIAQADGDAAYGDQNTDGSTSVRNFFPELRKMGATARDMLVAAAAKTWGVPKAQCQAKNHAVLHAASGKSLPYGELAAVAATLPVPKKGVKLKAAKDFQYIGKSRPLVDEMHFTTGTSVFGADVRLPGMLTAVIERPPALGAKVVSVDRNRAQAIKGVRAIELLDVVDLPCGFAPLGGVAVVADNTWAAMQGRSALSITWGPSPHAGYESLSYRQGLEQNLSKPGKVFRQQGSVEKVLGESKKTLKASYYVPHLSQAPMEPPAAVAHFTGDRCECWAPTQHPQAARAEVAKAVGLSEDKVAIHVTLLGGGFGRKSKPDFIVEAAILSRKMKAPVRVQWTRSDDLQHGFYHACSAQSLEAALDDKGKVVAWQHRTAFPSISATFAPGVKMADSAELGMGVVDLPFAIPNVKMEACEAEAHVRIGWMRSVANMHHAFAVGSFVDELAVLAGTDPRDFWLRLLGKPRKLSPKSLGVVGEFWNYGIEGKDNHIDTARLSRVIETVTERAGWAKRGDRKLGLSAHRSFGSYVAVVCEVVPGKRPGQIRIARLHSVIDCGQVIHRERVLAQTEGGAVFGLSLALHGEISAAGGVVQQKNFHEYPVVRMNEMPRELDVHLIESSGVPGGVGEPGVPPVAPALANAIFAATGRRVRELPLSRSGITALT